MVRDRIEDGTGPEDQPVYGLRVSWQSEAVMIEAAEFLVATRVQHDARIRAARNVERLRHPEQRGVEQSESRARQGSNLRPTA